MKSLEEIKETERLRYETGYGHGFLAGKKQGILDKEESAPYKDYVPVEWQTVSGTIMRCPGSAYADGYVDGYSSARPRANSMRKL